MLSLLKSIVPRALKERLKGHLGVPTMHARLSNLKRAGFQCSGAVDVGAYSGEWAVMCHEIFAQPVLMLEPQPQQQPVLARLALRGPFLVEPVAAGRAQGMAAFLLEETNSRLGIREAAPLARSIEVPVDTLDAVLTRRNFKANLLKVDVQGFEVEVLEGASASLPMFEVVVLEVSLIRIGPVPVFREVIEFMAQRNYRLYDFIPMYWRPLDKALWQGDAIFVRDDSPLVASERWN